MGAMQLSAFLQDCTGEPDHGRPRALLLPEFGLPRGMASGGPETGRYSEREGTPHFDIWLPPERGGSALEQIAEGCNSARLAGSAG
jgi:hypothetical protein